MSGTQKQDFCRISRMEESSVLTEFVDRVIHITDAPFAWADESQGMVLSI